jgi:hypothetical protein
LTTPNNDLNEIASVILDGSGNGTARISPGQPGSPGSGVGASRNSGFRWNVAGVAVSVLTNAKEAVAKCFISYGIQSSTPNDFQGQTQTGSTGDTCTVNATLRPGDWVTVTWAGGDANARATMRVFGTLDLPGVG